MTIALQAQDDAAVYYKNVFKFAPAKLFFNTFNIGYERELNYNTSLYSQSQIIYYEYKSDYEKGFMQDVGIKSYLMKRMEIFGIDHSIYFMPYVQIGSFDVQNYRKGYYFEAVYSNGGGEYSYFDKRKFVAYGGGLVVGIELLAMQRVSLELYVGGGIRMNTFKEPEEHPENWEKFIEQVIDKRTRWEYRGIGLKGGLEFGYRF
jgi:hypothetical protein